MNKPHKHAALIKAWADGAVIEHYRVGFGWEECSYNTPCWSPDTNYRIKPKYIKCRMYLWRDPYSNAIHAGVDEGVSPTPRDQKPGFVQWIGDWQEVEV